MLGSWPPRSRETLKPDNPPCSCSVLAEASLELCACNVPHRAVIASASDADALLAALRCAGVDDLQVS